MTGYADATRLASVPEGHETFEQDGELWGREPGGRTYLVQSEAAHSGIVDKVRDHVKGVDPQAGTDEPGDTSIARSDGEARALSGDASTSLADVIGAGGKAKRGAEDKAVSGPSESKTDTSGTDDSTSTSSGPAFASDAAAELAKSSGVDLSNVTGNGADGKLTKADVQKAIDGASS